jgi:cytochrome P450
MSLRVLADYMALPRRDIQRFRHWLAQIAPLLDGSLRASHVESGAQAVGELVEYLRPVIQARAADPGGDLISRVAASRAPTMSDTELVANCVLLLIGGYETTATLIGNGVVALLQEPGQLRRLRDDPGLGPVAVEEFLRFESPVQIVSRKALKDMPWAGVTFSKGNVVNIVLGSANRDPAQFSDPDRLDVGRPKNPHLAFAGGIHSCAGAALARVEARIAIEGLLRRFPNLALGPGDPVRRPGAVLRAWTSIPVRG